MFTGVSKSYFLLLGHHSNSVLVLILFMIKTWWTPGVNDPSESAFVLCSLLPSGFPGHTGCQCAELSAGEAGPDNGPEGPAGGRSAQPVQSHRGAPRGPAEALGAAAGSLCGPQAEAAGKAAAPAGGKG